MIDSPTDGLEESGFTADDTILVNTSAEPTDGDIVLIFYETRALLRRYYAGENGTLSLKADSSILDKEIFEPDEVRIIGRVEGRYSKF